MTYELTQGGDTYEIEPLSSSDWSAEGFYSYGSPDGASANTPWDLEREDTSQIFLFDGTDDLSLFVIHDKANTDSGGDATLSFTRLPEGGEWIVNDDPGDSYGRQRASWVWWPCCTDGGVFQGGLSDGVPITIDPSFDAGIDRWIVRSGASAEPIELDLTQPITIASSETSSVSASMTTLQFIPGKSENATEGGYPLDGSLMEVFREENIGVDTFGYSFEVPLLPVLDSWIKGDQSAVEDDVRPGDDELPMELRDARKKVEGKYSDEFGRKEFGIYRFENGISVSFETVDGETIDEESVEIEFNEAGRNPNDTKISLKERKNSVTVTPDHGVNGIPVEEWHGSFEERSNRKPRHYEYETNFEFDGVEGVRVLTISGGYAGFVQEWAERVADSPVDFFNTVWDWGLNERLAEIAWLLAPGRIQSLADYLTVVPNTHSFVEFIVLADGRRYARVWDASQYPSLATYVDGTRRSLEKMPYQPRERFNLALTAFHAQASAGVTPYHTPLDYYSRLVSENDRERIEEELLGEIEKILDWLPPLGWTVADFMPRIPRETVGFYPNGDPIENPIEPFNRGTGLLFPWSGTIEAE